MPTPQPSDDFRNTVDDSGLDPRLIRRDQVDAAIDLALSGETDAAIERMQALTADGETRLLRPLAELLAFRGRWRESAQYAGQSLAAMQGLDDSHMVALRIVLRAAEVTGDWPSVAEAAAPGLDAIAEYMAKRNAQPPPRMPRGLPSMPPALEQVYRTGRGVYDDMLDAIVAARHLPAVPLDFLTEFDVASAMSPGDLGAERYEQGAAEYRRRGLDEEKNRDKFFAIARNCGAREAMCRHYELGSRLLRWKDVSAVVRAYLERGQPDRAWDVIVDAMPRWAGGDGGSVAPTSLITERGFVGLMTPERCAWIVDTPRGGERPRATQAVYTPAPAVLDTDPVVAEWQSLLIDLSRRFLARDLADGPYEPTALHRAGYLGSPGATEKQIAEAEARLGVTLPPSYRAFLRASNGWAAMGGAAPGALRSVDRIDFLPVENSSMIDPPEYDEPFAHKLANDDELTDDLMERLQTSGNAILSRAIQISDWGDACLLMLSPDFVDENGEWACLDDASWRPGMSLHASFRQWFEKRAKRIVS